MRLCRFLSGAVRLACPLALSACSGVDDYPNTNRGGSASASTSAGGLSSGNGGSTGSANGGAANVNGGAPAGNGGSANPGSGGSNSSASGGAATGGALTGSGGTTASGGAPTTSDPLNTVAGCSSGSMWTRGQNPQMRPGEACITCHAQEDDAPLFSIAGTVFPTGHEVNDCNASASNGATIVITDQQNVEHRLTANTVGNFFLETAIPMPYKAKVVTAKGERLMITPQTSGDCNSCHTQAGTQGAPGRVTLPP
ncbi:MAG: hypothetical protein QM756_32170 [Polyangiaceae bacterium]